MNTWQEAARGIEPWLGSSAVYGSVIGVMVVGPTGLRVVGPGVDVAVIDPRATGATFPFPNLADPDTRAAFDRRLALRLGCDPEWIADEGVLFWPDLDVHYWRIAAGHYREATHGYLWEKALPTVRTDVDPLLARALAWRSVP